MNALEPLVVSLKTALCATLVTAVLGVMLARWRIHHHGRWLDVMDGFLLFPLALPPTVVGLILIMVFGRQSPVGAFLSSLGLQVLFTWEATVLAAVVVAFPIMYQTAKGAFRQVDQELILAARAFGCSDGRVLWRILIPLAWPGLLAGLILTFVRSLGEFGATLMVAGNIPGKTQTLPVAIFFRVEGGDMAGAAWLSGIILAISAAALLLLSRLGAGGRATTGG